VKLIINNLNEDPDYDEIGIISPMKCMDHELDDHLRYVEGFDDEIVETRGKFDIWDQINIIHVRAFHRLLKEYECYQALENAQKDMEVWGWG
jgi:hypothetical protein